MRALLLVALAALCVGCSSASPPDTAPGPRLRNAQMVSRERPDLRFPTIAQSGTLVDLRIEVEVEATGRPDLSTLRVTGVGAAENRQPIADWLERAIFRPPTQNGQPVRGRYETRMKVTQELRRIGTT